MVLLMSDNKKFYWLKLNKDFFKRHDIRIIEEMPNGKDYILFYLKLLLESVNHEGHLRFSETIPYNENMLSVITNTNIDIVRSAMKVLLELKMIEILDDSTIYMSEVLRITGSETASAERKRKSRANQKFLAECDNVTKCHTEIEIEKEIELDKEKDKDIIKSDKPTPEPKPKSKPKIFVPPTVDEIKAYCKHRKNNVDAQKFFDYYDAADWYDSKGVKMKSWKQKVITWETHNNNQQKGGGANEKAVGTDTNDKFANWQPSGGIIL